jgi:hypothetical protein
MLAIQLYHLFTGSEQVAGDFEPEIRYRLMDASRRLRPLWDNVILLNSMRLPNQVFQLPGMLGKWRFFEDGSLDVPKSFSITDAEVVGLIVKQFNGQPTRDAFEMPGFVGKWTLERDAQDLSRFVVAKVPDERGDSDPSMPSVYLSSRDSMSLPLRVHDTPLSLDGAGTPAEMDDLLPSQSTGLGSKVTPAERAFTTKHMLERCLRRKAATSVERGRILACLTNSTGELRTLAVRVLDVIEPSWKSSPELRQELAKRLCGMAPDVRLDMLRDLRQAIPSITTDVIKCLSQRLEEPATRNAGIAGLGELGPDAMGAISALLEYIGWDERLIMKSLDGIDPDWRNRPDCQMAMHYDVLKIMQMIKPYDEQQYRFNPGSYDWNQALAQDIETIELLADIGPFARDAVPTLTTHLRDQRPGVAEAVRKALAAIGPSPAVVPNPGNPLPGALERGAARQGRNKAVPRSRRGR